MEGGHLGRVRIHDRVTRTRDSAVTRRRGSEDYLIILALVGTNDSESKGPRYPLDSKLHHTNLSNSGKMLKFATFASDIDLSFYTSLASHKINHDKLDDSARRLLGLYEIRPSEAPGSSCRLQLHGNALTADSYVTCEQSSAL